MNKNEKIEVGRVYDLELNGNDFGKCLYLGAKRGSRIKYKHVLVRRGGEFIFSLVFEDYVLKDDKLTLGRKRNNPLSSSEREFLDDKLKKIGL